LTRNKPPRERRKEKGIEESVGPTGGLKQRESQGFAY